MKKITKLEIIILICIYLFGLYIWTLPFQDQSIPYGEGDATIHFFLASHMAINDKAMVVIPPYSAWMGLHNNPEFNPNFYLIYPPSMHTALAIFQITNTDRIVGFYLFLALMCSSVFFSLYILMRYLYGPIVGLLSGFLIMFSMRDNLTFLWGQWGTGGGLAFIAILMYVYYKYTSSYIDNKEKPIYLYVFTILLVAQYLIHPLGCLILFSFLGVYTVLLFLKERKIPFKIKRMLGCILVFVVLIVLLAPFQALPILKRFDKNMGSTEELEPRTFYELAFDWYSVRGGLHGMPAFYYSFKNIYYGFWMLPILIFGIISLLYYRGRRDLLLLGCVIGFYVINHLDLIGIFLGSKRLRFYYYESMIFYPIIAIGITRFANLFKSKKIIKYLILVVFLVFVVLLNVKASYTHFDRAYDGVLRLNQVEMDGIAWINDNVPDGKYIALVGAPTEKQQYWTESLTTENIITYDPHKIMPQKDPDLNKSTYLIIDYSFYYMYNDTNTINVLSAWEEENFPKERLIYNQDNKYKVYKLEN